MKIDLFTLFAQIVNFLILMLLLKRYLYGPIVRTMDERERRISASLAEAEQKESEARREAAVCHAERQEIEDKRGEMLSTAQQEAETWRRDLIQQARYEVEEKQQRWSQAIEREKESFLGDLRRRAGAQVYEIARQALADLATVELERHIIDTFLIRLPGLGKPGADAFQTAGAAAMATARQPEEAPAQEAVICTAFAINEETRTRVDKAVREHLAGNFNLRFEESPDLICGIELRAGGQAAAWSLRDYLETLDEKMSLAFAVRTEG